MWQGCQPILRPAAMLRHRLRDATWASLHARLVTIPGIWKKDPEPLRRFVEVVAYVLRTGIAWEDLPATFGDAGLHRLQGAALCQWGAGWRQGGSGPQQGRSDHQDPCARRRPWPTLVLP